jgi:hypothetical protein
MSGAPLGSPVSPGEYPYYNGYSYGSSYPYQSLTSASHLAHSQDTSSYYNNSRKDSESYSGSPLSPVAPHAISHAGKRAFFPDDNRRVFRIIFCHLATRANITSLLSMCRISLA